MFQEIWGVWNTFQQKGVSKGPPPEIFYDKLDPQKRVFKLKKTNLY